MTFDAVPDTVLEPTNPIPSEPCPMCAICTGPTRNGFVMCIGGQPTLVNDYPATGGPWAPAIKPDGTVVWFNCGGV